MKAIKGKAMSNETDLDWLARNVHKWPEGKCEVLVCCPRNVDTLIWSSVLSDAGWITKDQWLARRADLQNKPSWGGHEFAVIAQGGNGYWYGSNVSEEKFGHEELFCITGTGWNYICDGIVLGDWRDTLEKRPVDLSESAVTERLQEATDNVLAAVPELKSDKYKFDQIISIEDNQELSMTKQQEVKQDNRWFERGELPPVGVECDIRHSCWNSEKYEKVTVAAITNEYLIVKYATFEQHYMLKDISFRPIRTERDVLLSVIVEEMNRYDTDGKLADAILAAGFSLRDK